MVEPCYLFEKLFFVGPFKVFFEFICRIKMVFDGAFVFPRDYYELLDAACERLLDGMLDHGFIHDRQHFFGRRLCRGQESCPEPAGREYGFFYFFVHSYIVEVKYYNKL